MRVGLSNFDFQEIFIRKTSTVTRRESTWRDVSHFAPWKFWKIYVKLEKLCCSKTNIWEARMSLECVKSTSDKTLNSKPSKLRSRKVENCRLQVASFDACNSLNCLFHFHEESQTLSSSKGRNQIKKTHGMMKWERKWKVVKFVCCHKNKQRETLGRGVGDFVWWKRRKAIKGITKCLLHFDWDSTPSH